MPDVYQGNELWDLSLVDPDNRRPVDFNERRRRARGGSYYSIVLAVSDAPIREREREPHASMLAFLSRAMRPARERVEMSWDERAGWLRVQRGPITLLANLGAATIELPRPSGRCVLAFPTNLHAGDMRIALPPDGCAIWRG